MSDQGGVSDHFQWEKVVDHPKGMREEETLDEEDDSLQDYLLARDRTRRQIKLPSKYAHAEIIAFALNAAQLVDYDEPLSYVVAKGFSHVEGINYHEVLSPVVKHTST